MITTTKKVIDNKSLSKETLLTPRFYTTNFKELSELDVSSNLEEIEAIVEEFRIDYNRDHFIRDKEFLMKWNFFDEKTRNIFIEFLERSCTAEFSGFLLYKEISRNLKKDNPLLAEGFSFMSRDEARHAGFLNKAMSDFNVSLDLGFLTKTRKYTFFAPKFIFYATYLSEKIGYWRYITIYRHLEKNPTFRVLTMYLNDLQRTDFYSTIGLDAKQFDKHVIIKTNESSGTLFPVILDVENPIFFALLDRCHEANQILIELEKEIETSPIIKTIQKIPVYLQMAWSLLQLFVLPAIPTNYIWTQKD